MQTTRKDKESKVYLPTEPKARDAALKDIEEKVGVIKRIEKNTAFVAKYIQNRVVAITAGYFNPIHLGHIESFELARARADYLIVIVNNDEQQKAKTGGAIYQDLKTRMGIVKALKPVGTVVPSIDTDGTVCQTLESLIQNLIITHKNNPDEAKKPLEIIFCKGGDRYALEIPEAEVCAKYGVKIVDGLGEKIDHSSNYRNKASADSKPK